MNIAAVPKTFYSLLFEVQSSVHEVASLARKSHSEIETFTQFADLVLKFVPVLANLEIEDGIVSKNTNKVLIFEAIESLGTELNRAKVLVSNSKLKAFKVRSVETMAHDLGRSLGLVLFAIVDVASVEVKEQIGALCKELMNVKFDGACLSSSASPSCRDSEFGDCIDQLDGGNEIVEEDVVNVKFDGASLSSSVSPSCRDSEFGGNEIVEEDVVKLDEEQVVLQLKYGDHNQFKLAVSGLADLIRSEVVDNEWIRDEGVIPILLNRLASSKANNRLIIIQLLRSLALGSAENKKMMTEVASLSTLVKSLTRDMDERREAVGLLLDLTEIQSVRRGIGRIQGSIVMLVAMLNGNDPIASHDSGKLLNVLSSDNQNALRMAEAGYFKPLVQHLKEGSDMSKILMATSLSRMDLTDQTRSLLGQNGAIEPLVKMVITGKLEAKLSSLSALQNLSCLIDNVQRLISSGIVTPLLQLLFSVTSVLMTLREPASAILANIAQSESILVNQDAAQQMLSLLNLSSPVIQCHLLQAVNSIAAHSSATKVRKKMKANGAYQLLLPFLNEGNTKTRVGALNLLYTLSKDLKLEFTEQLKETNINTIVGIVSSSTLDSEITAAIGLLSNLPVNDKKTTTFLQRANLLPILMKTMNSKPEFYTPSMILLAESIAGVLIRFTQPSDIKLQIYSAQLGVIPLLVKLLSIDSPICQIRAATSLAQLSENSLSIRKSKKISWLCVLPSADTSCDVHGGHCLVKTTFCLVKAKAVCPLTQVLLGKYREPDEAVLCALATLLQDEIWENGSNYIVKMSGVEAIVKVLEMGNVKAQEKALWILEMIFRVETHRGKYAESVQVLLIDLARNGDMDLKPIVAKVLAQLNLLQAQSSYF